MGMGAADSQFHVLAVDDSLIDRKLIERLLKTSSYHVTTVDSGSKALQFLGFYEDEQSSSDSPCVSQEVGVNLIITDYCMPGMTGYDLLKKIKESSSLRDIPVVIMSSENVPSRINRCLEEGAEEFFLKPVRLSDLSRLKSHLMKNTKSKDRKQENQEKAQQEVDSERSVTQSEEHDQQLVNQQHLPVNSNKRKAMEGLSSDRTRPRYSCITTVV